MVNQVFISYRHEGPEHARAVRRLGQLLREAKVPVALDQFYLDEHPGGPDVGWPKWCEDCANESACVLIIASEGWFAAYEKTGPCGVGLGAATEADLFRQSLWDEKGNNARIRLTYLHDVAIGLVPVRLRAWEPFRPFSADDQVSQLIAWVAQRLGLNDLKVPTVLWPDPIPFQPDLADRVDTEWRAVLDLLAGRTRERILLLEGDSGLGKSAIVRQAFAYAEKLGLARARVDLKGGALDVAGVLGQLDLDLGEHLPNFTRDSSKTHLLRKDLRALHRPALIILDTYEGAASNQPVADWINQQLLTEVETALGLAVIVAGQKLPDFARAGWRDLARHMPLGPINEIAHWEAWIARKHPGFLNKGNDLQTVLRLAKGNPSLLTTYCEALGKD